jgi:hypothetical protein
MYPEQTPSGATLIACGEDFIERELSNSLPKCFHSLNCLLNAFLIDLHRRNKACYLLAIAGDRNALSALHFVEEAEKVSLGSDA